MFIFLIQILLYLATSNAAVTETESHEVISYEDLIQKFGADKLFQLGVIGSLKGANNQFKKIVFYTPDPHVGDTLLESFRLFSLVHSQYPNAKIVVSSPHADLLKPKKWLTTYRLPFKGPFENDFVRAMFESEANDLLSMPIVQHTLDQLAQAIQSMMEPETLLVLNLDGLRSAIFDGAFYRDLQLNGSIEWTTTLRVNIRVFQNSLKARLHMPKGALRIDSEIYFPQRMNVTYEGQQYGPFVSWQESRTIYERYDQFLKILFGKKLPPVQKNYFFQDLQRPTGMIFKSPFYIIQKSVSRPESEYVWKI